MVQLKRISFHLKRKVNGFQFHNGTIKTQAIRIKWQTVSHFNSIMVQLKLD